MRYPPRVAAMALPVLMLLAGSRAAADERRSAQLAVQVEVVDPCAAATVTLDSAGTLALDGGCDADRVAARTLGGAPTMEAAAAPTGAAEALPTASVDPAAAGGIRYVTLSY